MSRNGSLPHVSPALLEMLDRDGELDRLLDGRGLTFQRTPEPKVEPPRPWHPPPPDWPAEEAERRARERAQLERERAEIVAQELAKIAPEDELTYPAPAAKKRRWLP